MEANVMNVVDEVKENMSSDAYNKIAMALQAAHNKNVENAPKYFNIRYALTCVSLMRDDNEIKPRMEIQLFNTIVKYRKNLIILDESGDFHFNHILTKETYELMMTELAMYGMVRMFFEKEGVYYSAVVTHLEED